MIKEGLGEACRIPLEGVGTVWRGISVTTLQGQGTMRQKKAKAREAPPPKPNVGRDVDNRSPKSPE